MTAFVALKDKLPLDTVKGLIGEQAGAITEIVAKVKGAAAKLMEKADVKKVLGDLIGKLGS